MYYQPGHGKSLNNCILGKSIRGNQRNLTVESPIGQKFITQGVNFLLQLAAAQESPEYFMDQCQQGRKLQGKRWGERKQEVRGCQLLHARNWSVTEVEAGLEKMAKSPRGG